MEKHQIPEYLKDYKAACDRAAAREEWHCIWDEDGVIPSEPAD